MTEFSYRGVPFRKHYPPADPKDITKVEDEVGGRLPDEYREFLLTLDGGVPERGLGLLVSRLGDEPEQKKILEFYTASPKTEHSIHIAWHGYEFNERVPDRIVPIGRFYGDYRPCISLREADYGRLYMWAPSHLWEFDDDENVQSEKDLYFLANSFNEFLDALKPLPEEE